MDESSKSMIEVREDLMVSPVGDSEPTLREAHFLKPISTSSSSIFEASFSDILHSSSSISEQSKKEWPLIIHFNGWRYPHKKWVEWVDTLHPRYESLWKKVGILEAIMSSKCYVKKNQDLAFGVAEKWCSETNTFVFPWGEATITLEDVMILGGFPVLGDPVFSSLQNPEMKEVEQRLIIARQEPWRSRKGKASTSAFMDFFVNSGSDIEHEAFLATWLSMFVFSHKGLVINKSVFPIAIHLTRGNPIALAPAVLASIYKDIGLLKETIVSLIRNPIVTDKFNLELNLQSPFYLVKVWVWERFRNLQPQPNLINHEDPLLRKWDMVKALEIESARMALDSAMEDFLWRPYVRYADKFRVFYPGNALCVPFGSHLDEELVSFVTCMRNSELVGIDSSIKQYLPHRVAMQFGMDQDVPDCVPRFNETKVIAWENYCRPIFDRNLYFPSRLFEADVTTRYVRWWKQSVLGYSDFAKNVVRGKRSERSSNHKAPRISKVNRSSNDADVPPEFPPKFSSTEFVGKSCVDGADVITSGFLPRRLETVHSGYSVRAGLKGNENADTDVLTSFAPKPVTLASCISVENIKPVLEESNGGGMIQDSVKVTTSESKHLSNQSSSASTTAHDDVQKILSLKKQVAKDKIEPSMESKEKDFKDAKPMDLEQRISKLETVITKLKIARLGHG